MKQYQSDSRCDIFSKNIMKLIIWLFDPLIDKMKKSSLGLRGLSASYTCITYKQYSSR